jgi:hypothetical protein
MTDVLSISHAGLVKLVVRCLRYRQLVSRKEALAC